jgi:hypothetical protein
MQLIILQCKNRLLLESALRKEFLSICIAQHKSVLSVLPTFSRISRHNFIMNYLRDRKYSKVEQKPRHGSVF